MVQSWLGQPLHGVTILLMFTESRFIPTWMSIHHFAICNKRTFAIIATNFLLLYLDLCCPHCLCIFTDEGHCIVNPTILSAFHTCIHIICISTSTTPINVFDINLSMQKLIIHNGKGWGKGGKRVGKKMQVLQNVKNQLKAKKEF